MATTQNAQPTGNIVEIAAQFVASSKTLLDARSRLRAHFPNLDDVRLAEIAKVLADSEATPQAVPPAQPVAVAPTAASATPKQKGERTRPRTLMVKLPDGKEITMAKAVQKILGKKAMTVPEIEKHFEEKGWVTNSHADAKVQHSIYVTLNGKTGLFQKLPGENQKKTTYKNIAADANGEAARPEKPSKASKKVQVQVTQAEGRAPSPDKMFEVISSKFGLNEKFFLRDVASVLGVPAKVLSVNMQNLQAAGKVKVVATAKPEGASVPAKLYARVQ